MNKPRLRNFRNVPKQATKPGFESLVLTSKMYALYIHYILLPFLFQRVAVRLKREILMKAPSTVPGAHLVKDCRSVSADSFSWKAVCLSKRLALYFQVSPSVYSKSFQVYPLM